MRHLPVFLIALSLAAAGCTTSTPTGPRAALAAARSQWAQHAPPSYSMVVSPSCECLPGTSAPALVTVRGGVVESRRYVATGADVSPQYAPLFPTVPEMFAMIDDAMQKGVQPISVQYAPLGYPSRFSLGDPAADAPMFTVSEFHAL